MHFKGLTHHHDESTLGVKISRSKIKMKYILEMGLEWIFVPFLIPIALLSSDKPRDFIGENEFLPFMYWLKLYNQVWKSLTIVRRPSLENKKNFTRMRSALKLHQCAVSNCIMPCRFCVSASIMFSGVSVVFNETAELVLCPLNSLVWAVNSYVTHTELKMTKAAGSCSKQNLIP